MLHSNTERLIDYWRARKADRLSPSRSAIDPADFTELLPQVFMLGRPEPGRHLFRLTGEVVSGLHGRDLRQTEFLSLWSPTDRPRLAAALEASRRTAEPVIAAAEGRSREGGAVRLELMLAPLRADAAPIDRFLGLYQPLSSLEALRDRPVVELGLVRLESYGERPAAPPLRLAALNGQLIGAVRSPGAVLQPRP